MSQQTEWQMLFGSTTVCGFHQRAGHSTGPLCRELVLGYGHGDVELCPICLEAAPDTEKAKRAERDTQRRQMLELPQTQLEHLGVPEQYHGCALNEFPEAVQVALIGAYRGEKPLVTLSGEPGAGKSRAVYALLRYAWGKTFGVRVPTILNWPHWCREMHTRLFGGAEGMYAHNSNISSLCDTPALVVIDDVMAGAPDKQTMLAFMDVVETREKWGRPTVLTTNLKLTDLSAIDDRLASRCSPDWTILDGSDHRVEATK